MTRVLLAKPGLDGHDRGLYVVARALRDSGCEVIVTGRFWSPKAIANAAVQDDVDVVGLSILAGGHMGLTQEVIDSLREQSADCSVVVGGAIPDDDIPALIAMGCAAVFPGGSLLPDIVRWFTIVAPDRLWTAAT